MLIIKQLLLVMSSSRRSFLKQFSFATAGVIAVPQVLQAAVIEANRGRTIKLNKNDVIVFQGDSITDASRKREELNPNTATGFGSGYALQAAGKLLKDHPDKNLQIFNRGISGNKVYQLAERWEIDCIELKPDILSILIGVNDFWHMMQGKYTGNVEVYENDYRALLRRTKEKLPGVKLIIGEPFGVAGIKAVTEAWYPAFNTYRKIAANLAAEFNAIFIPYQEIFDKVQKLAPNNYWTGDGVHPSIAGARLMSEAWLKAVK
jgi:lysophospholipase L1-like esterase